MKKACTTSAGALRTRLSGSVIRYQVGFSLIEMMIAMALGLLLLLVISTVFVSSRQTFREQEDNARIQENGRFALEILGRSIKQAGHVEVPFNDFKVAFEGMAITGTNGGTGVADTLTIQYEGVANVDQDCEGALVDVTGRLIQNHFNLDAVNAELQCTGVISDTPAAPGAPPTGSVLLENVEDLQLLYGVDTDANQSVDQYVASPADWNQVLAVRLCVLVRSDKTNIVPAGTNYFDCTNTSVANAADRRMRRAFSATYNLRNRIHSLP